jgi:SnoaL-like domain
VSVADAGLSARAAQLLYAYARAVDDGDIEALRGLAVPDVRLTRSDGTKQGIETFLDLYRDFAASAVQGSKHVIANVQAFPEPDGGVRALAYFEATMFDAGPQTRLVIGEYSDSVREVDGQLRLTHKRITVQRVVTIPSGTTQYGGITPVPTGQEAI